MQVTARVFSLELTPSAVSVLGLRLNRVPHYSNIISTVKKEERHYQTAEINVTTPASITTTNDALNYAEEQADILRVLLSFADGHDVPISELMCQGQKISRTMRVGSAKGAPVIFPPRLSDYLNTCLPVITDKSYVEKTNVMMGMQFLNEAHNLPYAVIELEIPILFAGLEVLTNSFSDENKKSFVLTEEQWDSLTRDIAKLIDVNSDYTKAKERIMGTLGFARASIGERLGYFVESLGLGDYSTDIAKIVKMRNDILHGRPLEKQYNGENSSFVYLKCERLFTKMILKLLKIYDSNSAYPAYTRQDLLATG